MRLVWTLVVCVLVGCSDERIESTAIANDGVYPSMSIRDDGASTRLRVDLDVGGPNGTNLTLTGGESLQVTVNGQASLLRRETDIFSQFYELYLPSTSVETRYSIDWYRDSQPDVLGSSVTMALPFAITSPSASTPQLSSVPVGVTWSPATPAFSMVLRIELHCSAADGSSVVALDVVSVADTGSYAYSIGDRLDAQLDTVDRARVCRLLVRGTRERAGTLANEFTRGGSIMGRREVTVDGISVTIDH